MTTTDAASADADRSPRHWHRSGRVRVLAALNIGLAALAAAVITEPWAAAQAASERAPGSYAIVGGRPVAQGNGNIVYIVDSTNAELIAMRWDEGSRSLRGIGFRDLTADSRGRPDR